MDVRTLRFLRRVSHVTERDVHIRQVALVAREFEPVVAALCDVLGIEVGFRDPGVGEFGLHNAVMPIGTTFLEVVSPIRPDTTAGRFLDRRAGDGGYMAIFQTDDLAADRVRLGTLGVRIVWELTLDDIATVHLHPRDIGGAIVSLDQPRPPASWRWAGPGWEAKARTGRVRAIDGVTLSATDPARLAARWSDVLGLGPARREDGAYRLALDPGSVRFVAGDADALIAVGLVASDADAVLAAARARALPTDGRSVTIGGVRFDLHQQDGDIRPC